MTPNAVDALYRRAEGYARRYWPTLDGAELVSFAMGEAWRRDALRWPFVRLVMARRACKAYRRPRWLPIDPGAIGAQVREVSPVDAAIVADYWPHAEARASAARILDPATSKRVRHYHRARLAGYVGGRAE